MIMKKYSMKRLIYISLAFGVVFTTGCKRYSSDFGNTNVDPSATTSPILAALLTNVEAGLAGNYAAGTGGGTRGGLYAQYFSETQYTDVSLYALPQIDFEGHYSGPLEDLQNIINTNESNNMSMVAKILQSYIFSVLSDRYGDIPYSEALTGNPLPKFDAQEGIYKGCISTLTAAVAGFDNTSVISGDVIFNGSVAKWKKTANSLRMRLALQLTKKYPSAGGYAATEFNAALNDPGGYIASNADNFVVKYPGGNYKSPWWSVYDGRKDYGESDVMVALMGSLGDGRQAAFGTSTTGVPYGRVRGYVDPWTGANPNWSRILAESYRAEDGSAVIISAAQTFLARAEAADRGWTAENMNSLYTQGINASFAQWNLPAPSASYFTQAGVVLSAPAGTNANFKNLAIQQYIASYPDGGMGWNIWRRTGYPVLTPAVDATNSSKQIPRRYTYGQTSYGSNTAAVTATAAAMPGGDTQDSKVWWDQ